MTPIQRIQKHIRDARYYRNNRDKVLARVKAYEKAHRNAITARWRAKAAAHPEWVRRHNRKNYQRHRDSFIKRAKEWISSNRDRHNEYTKKTCRRYTDELNEIYVRHKLRRDSGIPASAFPDSMVKLKQTLLKLKRLCQNQKI